MGLDEAYEILTVGTHAQIASLAESGIEYSYGPVSNSFSVWSKGKMDCIRSQGLFEVLNCVKLYGNEHTF